jgi:uncharacterized membrane protein
VREPDKPQASAPEPASAEPGSPAGLHFADFTRLPLVMVAVMFLAAAIVYPYMPARFPTHWGASGVADGWSTKSFMSVFFQPLLALGLYGLLIVVPMMDPKRANIAKSIGAYNVMLDAIIGLQVVIFGATTMAAFKPGFDVTRVMLLAMGAMFLVLGNVMQDVKQNFTMGVRVSWTLADDVVWEKTNRLGGRLFMGLGAVTLVAAFVPAPWGIFGMLGAVLLMLPVLMTYSYLLYRKRHPEA